MFKFLFYLLGLIGASVAFFFKGKRQSQIEQKAEVLDEIEQAEKLRRKHSSDSVDDVFDRLSK